MRLCTQIAVTQLFRSRTCWHLTWGAVHCGAGSPHWYQVRVLHGSWLEQHLLLWAVVALNTISAALPSTALQFLQVSSFPVLIIHQVLRPGTCKRLSQREQQVPFHPVSCLNKDLSCSMHQTHAQQALIQQALWIACFNQMILLVMPTLIYLGIFTQNVSI